MADDLKKEMGRENPVIYSQNLTKNAELKRAFRKAKLFEIRRLVRRIRQFSNKKGTGEQLKKNQRKVSRLEMQLEFAKDVHLETLIKHFLMKSDQEDTGDVVTQRTSNVESLVTERLLKAVDVEKLTASKSKGKIKKQSQNNVPETQQDTPRHSLSNDSAVVEKSNSQSAKMQERVKHSDEYATDSDTDSTTDATADSVFAKSARKYKQNKEKQDRKRKLSDDFSDDSLSRTAESMFVGSLKRTKASNKTKSKKTNQHMNDGKKNRTGQRARQKQWEKLYGKKAKHCLSSKEQPAKTEKGKKVHHRQSHGGKDHVLHPSWVASKFKRKQESILEFKGQKITFDEEQYNE